jgi:hypothetical protein
VRSRSQVGEDQEEGLRPLRLKFALRVSEPAYPEKMKKAKEALRYRRSQMKLS